MYGLRCFSGGWNLRSGTCSGDQNVILLGVSLAFFQETAFSTFYLLYLLFSLLYLLFAYFTYFLLSFRQAAFLKKMYLSPLNTEHIRIMIEAFRK